MLLSGGVDSTVCTALLRKALSEEQIIAVHIDTGLMRKGESQRVMESLQKIGKIPFQIIYCYLDMILSIFLCINYYFVVLYFHIAFILSILYYILSFFTSTY